MVRILALAMVLAGCAAPPPSPIVLGGETMGTTWTLKLAELPLGVERAELLAEIELVLERVNDEMSTYRPNSELSRFNDGAANSWIEVSPSTASVVARAIEIGRLSGGALDVTVGPLVDLWGFGADPRPGRVPSVDELTAARAAVGLDLLEVQLDPPALRKLAPGLRVDLSSIAKGEGVDRVAALLEARGVQSWLIEIGGEMHARGLKARDRPWSVAIERPTSGQRAIAKVIPLRDIAIATSGDYRNFFEEDGVRYSHLLDPRTGAPVRHRLASVSVLADNCRDADAWATALDVLGPDEGYAVAVEQGLAALLLVREGDGFRELASPAFVAQIGESR